MRASHLIAIGLAATVLTACTGLAPTIIFAGTQRPIAGTCDPAGQASLTRRGNAIAFTPSDGTLTLTGTLTGSTIAAGANLTGADKAPYRLSFTGQLNGRVITGTYTTPRCRAAVTLTQTSD